MTDRKLAIHERLVSTEINTAPYGSKRVLGIHDYARDSGPGEGSDFCVVFTMSLCILELKRTLISLLLQTIRF